jgi:hypothetical protein
MLGFYLALFVLPAAIIALSVILARGSRLGRREPRAPHTSDPGS